VPTVGALVAALRRTSAEDATEGRAALATLADLLDAAGEPAGAVDARAQYLPAPGPPRRDLDALLDAAGPTWTWPAEAAPAGPAALVTALLDGLVAEVDDGVALSPTVPEAWLGQGWEVHDLPTAFGRLSFAVRWHGERPALLWELEPHRDEAVRLTVPALDPAWWSDDSQGEALLAPVAVPERAPVRRGLRIPVSIEPLRRGPS
jgi:hypothetical protein